MGVGMFHTVPQVSSLISMDQYGLFINLLRIRKTSSTIYYYHYYYYKKLDLVVFFIAYIFTPIGIE